MIRDVWRNKRWKKFPIHTKLVLGMTAALVLGGTFLFTLIEWNNPATMAAMPAGEKIMAGAFQSVTTRTAGFNSIDQNGLYGGSFLLTIILMFIGAAPGSTGGGIKVSRLLILCKSARKELQLYLHPNAVKKIKMDDKAIPHEVVRATNMFLFVYIMIFVISLLIISLDNLDMVSNFTAIAATLNNIGPGLGAVGPTGNLIRILIFPRLL